MTLSDAIIGIILKLKNERKITTNKLATLSVLAQKVKNQPVTVD